jgi:hypothetical protein
LFTINCTGFFWGKKTKLFSLVFQKKKKLNSATVEHGFTVPQKYPLLLQSCGWAAKISGSYHVKSILLALPNTDMCGCGWTSPAITLPNSIIKWTNLPAWLGWVWFMLDRVWVGINLGSGLDVAHCYPYLPISLTKLKNRGVHSEFRVFPSL